MYHSIFLEDILDLINISQVYPKAIQECQVNEWIKKLNDMLKLVRSHGWTRNLDEKERKNYSFQFKTEKFYEPYTFYDLAYNLRPTEINGFLALEQIKFLKKISTEREVNFYKFYNVYIKNKNFVPYKIENMNILSNFAFPVICKNKLVLNKYINIFKKLKIEIRPFISGNIARQPFFKKYVKKKFDLPNADTIHDLCFYFPNHNDLTQAEINRIMLAIKK
jgi:CDP-6-deoxy-D-xylo-4-hexulose-3-dehydrase